MEGKVAHSKKETWKVRLHTLKREHGRKVKHHYKKNIFNKKLYKGIMKGNKGNMVWKVLY